nr:MAG: hypothetical protein [Bacteriophage sp.]
METKKRTQATDIAEIATKLDGKMDANKLIGKTFAYKGIGNMVYIVVVQALEPKGERYDADSYIGKQTLIFPNGESMTQDWACVRGAFERKKRRGELKVLR